MLKLVFAAVATAFLGATASPSKGNDIEVKWLNICRGPIHLFWVAHGGKSEEFISEIPEDHYFSVDTQAGNVFRIKFANDNRGVFGEDVLEEWIIEDVDSPEQEIKICLLARQREEAAELERQADEARKEGSEW